MRGAKPNTTIRARALRQYDNDSEAKLWSELRDRRLNGFKFVRQYPIGPYFADFACREKHLVVEIDGSQHAESANDEQRNRFMNESGWSVVRFWNTDVFSSIQSIIETIVAICEGRLTERVEAPDLKFYPASNK
jgi:very-short-patch-repair endonuclease